MNDEPGQPHQEVRDGGIAAGRGINVADGNVAGRDLIIHEAPAYFTQRENAIAAIKAALRTGEAMEISSRSTGYTELQRLAEVGERLLAVHVVIAAEGESADEGAVTQLNAVLEEVKRGWQSGY